MWTVLSQVPLSCWPPVRLKLPSLQDVLNKGEEMELSAVRESQGQWQWLYKPAHLMAQGGWGVFKLAFVLVIYYKAEEEVLSFLWKHLEIPHCDEREKFVSDIPDFTAISLFVLLCTLAADISDDHSSGYCLHLRHEKLGFSPGQNWECQRLAPELRTLSL